MTSNMAARVRPPATIVVLYSLDSGLFHQIWSSFGQINGPWDPGGKIFGSIWVFFSWQSFFLEHKTGQPMVIKYRYGEVKNYFVFCVLGRPWRERPCWSPWCPWTPWCPRTRWTRWKERWPWRDCEWQNPFLVKHIHLMLMIVSCGYTIYCRCKTCPRHWTDFCMFQGPAGAAGPAGPAGPRGPAVSNNIGTISRPRQ